LHPDAARPVVYSAAVETQRPPDPIAGQGDEDAAELSFTFFFLLVSGRSGAVLGVNNMLIIAQHGTCDPSDRKGRCVQGE